MPSSPMEMKCARGTNPESVKKGTKATVRKAKGTPNSKRKPSRSTMNICAPETIRGMKATSA